MAFTFGDLKVGCEINLTERGSAVSYVVVHQGKPSIVYDDSCDGTWVMRVPVDDHVIWNMNGSNSYPDSEVHRFLNDEFLHRFDKSIQDAIKEVEIPIRHIYSEPPETWDDDDALTCRVFIPSGYEIGWNNLEHYDGSKLDYFNSHSEAAGNLLLRAYDSQDNYVTWWLRTPYTQNTEDCKYIATIGCSETWPAVGSRGVRPMFIVDPTTEYNGVVHYDLGRMGAVQRK